MSLIESIHPESHPSLTESWSSITVKSQDFIRRSMINSQSYFERTQILVRLVEQLQQQITRLERQIDPVIEAKPG
jgi:hypothetical protein